MTIKGYDELSSQHKQWFELGYSKQMAAMNSQRRKQLSKENITKVEFDSEECAVKVYFNTGGSWHYTKNGDWY